MELKEYKSKRKFPATPEPEPVVRPGGESLVFVIQKHAARALHYDLRLELDGVLKSWAVPRGPSLDPSVKRLAVRVEDHPLDYRNFEGVIPAAHYGAGSVMIWDRGFYHYPSVRNRLQSERFLREGLHRGDLKFVLEGEKLHGEFALVKIRKDEKSWLLLKKKDRFAAADDILLRDRSVASQKTLNDISGNDSKTADLPGPGEALWPEYLKDAPLAPMPHGIEPMLATPAKEPFDDPDWIFEVKWDGYRALAEIQRGDVSLYSRNHITFERKFAPILKELRKLNFDAVLDGEIVVVDDRGYPDFQKLQDYGKSSAGHLLYYVFDLLYFAGHDLVDWPLTKRKDLLKRILPSSGKIKFNDHVRKEGILFFKTAREKGLEGIVAKYGPGAYHPGKRSREWLKIKTQLTQEGVIAGFTQPRGNRKGFGALVLGVSEGGEWVFIGHAGGGLSAAKIDEILKKLNPLIRRKCPFKVEPKTNTKVTWVKPQLVCEVVYRGWTGEGLLRQPVFLRLREDRTARDVVRESTDAVFSKKAGGKED